MYCTRSLISKRTSCKFYLAIRSMNLDLGKSCLRFVVSRPFFFNSIIWWMTSEHIRVISGFCIWLDRFCWYQLSRPSFPESKLVFKVWHFTHQQLHKLFRMDYDCKHRNIDAGWRNMGSRRTVGRWVEGLQWPWDEVCIPRCSMLPGSLQQNIYGNDLELLTQYFTSSAGRSCAYE